MIVKMVVVVTVHFCGLLTKPHGIIKPWGIKMIMSKYWFRTRRKKNDNSILYSSISTEETPGYSIYCQCDRCNVGFNRNTKAKKYSFKFCDICEIKENAHHRFTTEVR